MNKNSELQSHLLQSIYPGTIQRMLDQKKVECINNIFYMNYLHINSIYSNPRNCWLALGALWITSDWLVSVSLVIQTHHLGLKLLLVHRRARHKCPDHYIRSKIKVYEDVLS